MNVRATRIQFESPSCHIHTCSHLDGAATGSKIERVHCDATTDAMLTLKNETIEISVCIALLTWAVDDDHEVASERTL